jgi:transposase
VLEGILWRLKNGTRWREIPPRYGPWRTCHARLVRWQEDGTWLRILQALQSLQADSIDWANISLDATRIKTHRSASGARHPKGDEAIGRSRGGRSSKLHLVVDSACRPLAVLLTAGQASDAANLLPALNEVRVNRPGPGRPKQRPVRLLVDRAYGARAYR